MKHQKDYEVLRVALHNFYSVDQGQGDPLAGFRSVRALLKEREKRGEAEDALMIYDDEEEEEEGHKQRMMEIGAKVEEKVEEALDYLLDVAIERFGYSACDVFRAVFDFDSTTTTFRRNSFNISFEQLNDIVASLVIGAVNFELSNPIVAISPVYSASNPLGDVDWKVAFNSGWVATEVMKKLNIAKNIDACLLRGIPH